MVTVLVARLFPRRWSRAAVDALVAERAAGTTLRRLGERYGRSGQQINTILRRRALGRYQEN